MTHESFGSKVHESAGGTAACECGRTPPSLVYVCEHCPRLTDAERAEWRRLQGYEPVAAPVADRDGNPLGPPPTPNPQAAMIAGLIPKAGGLLPLADRLRLLAHICDTAMQEFALGNDEESARIIRSVGDALLKLVDAAPGRHDIVLARDRYKALLAVAECAEELVVDVTDPHWTPLIEALNARDALEPFWDSEAYQVLYEDVRDAS